MMSLRLENRVALVTGGTGALGRSVVRRLLGAGAAVHVTWIEKREVDAVREFLGDAAERVSFHKADLTDAENAGQVASAVVRTGGRLDILANLAGGFAAGPVAETDPGTWRKMLTLNATTAFFTTRAVVPFMQERRSGRIVNVAAGPALHRGAAGMSAYAASKAAVLNLTYSLASELGPDGITVNAIVPSIIDTPANREAMPDADTSTWLPPDEIAEVVGFLASDAAAIVTGTAVNLARGADA